MLQKALARLEHLYGLAFAEDALPQLEAYVDLLLEFNQSVNLVSRLSRGELIRYHVLDAISAAPYLPQRGRMIDIGSGGGLPGLPLAIALPHNPWVLVESVGKKSRFLVKAIHELGLVNTEVVADRVESLAEPSLPYDVLVARGFAAVDLIVELAYFLLATRGYFLLFKSKKAWSEEAAGISYLQREGFVFERLAQDFAHSLGEREFWRVVCRECDPERRRKGYPRIKRESERRHKSS